MHNIIILFIVIFFIPSFETFGQEEDWEVARREGVKFSNTLDSLFLENKYEQITEICNQPSRIFNSVCTFNLIGTYYFLGDSLKSWELLNKVIADYSDGDSDAYTLNNLLSKDYTAYKKFLINSTAKNYIVSHIDSFYMTEPVSDKQSGIILLHLLIEDQWVRNTSSLYDHFKPERRFLLPSKMDSMQAIQAQRDHSTKVFNFYKKQNKVFSKAEVGRIYYWQLLLFFHEWDLTRREFYHELVKQGVKVGALTLEDQANFEAGTEYIIMGSKEYFNHVQEITNQLIKKYSLPSNFRIRLI